MNSLPKALLKWISVNADFLKKNNFRILKGHTRYGLTYVNMIVANKQSDHEQQLLIWVWLGGGGGGGGGGHLSFIA